MIQDSVIFGRYSNDGRYGSVIFLISQDNDGDLGWQSYFSEIQRRNGADSESDVIFWRAHNDDGRYGGVIFLISHDDDGDSGRVVIFFEDHTTTKRAVIQRAMLFFGEPTKTTEGTQRCHIFDISRQRR